MRGTASPLCGSVAPQTGAGTPGFSGELAEGKHETHFILIVNSYLNIISFKYSNYFIIKNANNKLTLLNNFK